MKIDIKVDHRKITKELKDGHSNTKVYCNGKIYDVKNYNKVGSTNRKISLLLLTIFETFEHYILIEPVEEEIAHEYYGPGRKVNMTMVLIEMFKRNLFEPMAEEVQNKLDYSFRHPHGVYNFYRPIVVKRRSINLSKKLKYGKLL